MLPAPSSLQEYHLTLCPQLYIIGRVDALRSVLEVMEEGVSLRRMGSRERKRVGVTMGVACSLMRADVAGCCGETNEFSEKP